MAEETKPENANDTIFMRNLSYDSTEEGLKEYIEENFGKTQYCLICRNKETGESRGTGFAKFEDAENVTKCLKEFKDTEFQHKFHFDGRNIIVLPVIPKDKVDEVKQNREKDVLKQERHKRRERLIKERVLAKQRHRRPNPTGQQLNPRGPNQANRRPNQSNNRPNQANNRPNQANNRPNQANRKPNQAADRPHQPKNRPRPAAKRPNPSTKSPGNKTKTNPAKKNKSDKKSKIKNKNRVNKDKAR